MRYCLIVLGMVLVAALPAKAQDTGSAKSKLDAGLAGKVQDPKPEVKENPTVTEIAGKSFKQWTDEIDSPDPTKCEVAMKTIVNFGPEKAYEAVPKIIGLLKKHPQKPLDLSIRVNGILVLGTVFQYKDKPDAKLFKDSVPIFREAIKDRQEILRIRALQALPYLGPLAREAMPEVVETISDSTTYEARDVAIQTLAILVQNDLKSGLGSQQAKALAALYKALGDESYLVRHSALTALVPVNFCVSDNEKKIIKDKIGLLAKRERDPSVLIQAHATLINLKRNFYLQPIDKVVTKDHLQPIVGLIGHNDPTTRLNALQAVGRLGPPAMQEAMLPVVSAMRNDPNIDIQVTAVVTLIQIEAFEATGDLKKVMNDKNSSPALKEAAEDAILQLEFIKKQKTEEEGKKKTDKKRDKK